MHSSTSFRALTVLALCSLNALAKPVDLPAGISIRAANTPEKDKKLAKMEFRGPIKQGGPIVTLHGTVQEVYAQIMKMDPDYKVEEKFTAEQEGEEIEKRTIVSSTCSLPNHLQPAPLTAGFLDGINPINDGIAYLKNLGGGLAQCSCPPHSCTRISCSWDAAIYMCNDNSYTVSPQCHYLGDTMAQLIDNNCQRDDTVGGKDYDSQNYSITIQADNC